MNIDVTKYFIANFIYGTISFFLHFVNASSEFVVLCRGLLGSLFIFIIMLINKELPDRQSIKDNFKYLIISGAALGFNWVALFAGYRYGSAITSLCNYTAPIIITIISTIIYKEKMSLKQLIFVLMAFIGIIFVSGVFETNSSVDYHCVIYGMLAAIGFTILVINNRKLKDIKPLDKTITQLLVSALVVLPYVYFNNGFPTTLDTRSLLIIILLGFVHTGLAYIFYFNSISVLPIHKVVIIGYIEPVLSVIVGVLVFNEPISIFGIIGAVLIILAALFSELSSK